MEVMADVEDAVVAVDECWDWSSLLFLHPGSGSGSLPIHHTSQERETVLKHCQHSSAARLL